MIRDGPRNKNFIKVYELLELFDLDLDLPKEVLDIDVEDCFRKGELTVSDNTFKFRFKDYAVAITPGNCKDILIEKTGSDGPYLHYKEDGTIYWIT